MKIAILAPPYLPVPSPSYGGSEKMIAHLADGLVAKGHDVTLFASGDSHSHAKIASVLPEHLGVASFRDKLALLPMLHYTACFKREKEFDLIHNHAQHLPHFLGAFSSIPVIHTLHMSLYRDEVPEEIRTVMRHFKDDYFVSISKNQQRGLPELNIVGNVYNGVDLEAYPVSDESIHSEPYLLWVGRITQKKGPLPAIRAAKTLGIPLKMAAVVEPTEQGYFNQVIKPEIDGQLIHSLGEQTHEQLIELYQHAFATLFPVTWHEPFGLVMIESMACGTPVVGYDFGAIDEVIRDGETGFIVPTSKRDSIHQWKVRQMDAEGLVQAITYLKEMPSAEYQQMRNACRARVAEHFTAELMVAEYELIYSKILETRI
jgi:glycosyltransferase involved in cell wall biosynthesis